MLDFRSKDARLLASVMERSARLQIFLRTFFDVQCSSEMLGHIGQIGQSTDCKRLESWPSSSSSFCFSAFSSPQLGVQSQHYRPSTEITSVEKPAMLMVAILAITNIKCNTLLYTTRFIQARHTMPGQAGHNIQICLALFYCPQTCLLGFNVLTMNIDQLTEGDGNWGFLNVW